MRRFMCIKNFSSIMGGPLEKLCFPVSEVSPGYEEFVLHFDIMISISPYGSIPDLDHFLKC